MSDRIRRLLRARQDAMLEAMEPNNLDSYQDQLREQLAAALENDGRSAVPLGEEMVQSLYEPLLGDSMARRIVDQGSLRVRHDLMQKMSEGGRHLMAPMVNSVLQLDR